MKKYNLKYHVEFGQFTKEELKGGKVGGCDELLICSYVEQPNGGGSYLWISTNGKEGVEMEAHRKFKCMTMLARELSTDPDLGPGHQLACSTFFQLIQESYRRARENEQGND